MTPKEPKNRKRDDAKPRDKVLVTRDRDSKSTGKSYRDRDERKQDREGKNMKKHDEKKLYNRREDKDSYSKEDRTSEYKNRDDRRDPKDHSGHQKERSGEEKKGKSYEKMRQEKRLRLAESKKHGGTDDNAETSKEYTQSKKEFVEKKKNESTTENDNVKSKGGSSNQMNSVENKLENLKTDNLSKISKDLSELKLNSSETDVQSESSSMMKVSEKFKYDVNDDSQDIKSPKIVKRRSSLESGGEASGSDGSHLRRHKSLDGGDQSNLQKNEVKYEKYKDKDKNDPRLERRIRNKDRPAMEIYRPGMGKFSKQRLEREKSSHDDRASLSQSPTPSGKVITAKTTEVPSTSNSGELRSMTFKRSVSRDAS